MPANLNIKRTIRGLEDFGIDIFLMKEFYDKKVTMKDLKTRKMNSQQNPTHNKQKTPDKPVNENKFFMKKNTVPVHQIYKNNSKSYIFEEHPGLVSINTKMFSLNQIIIDQKSLKQFKPRSPSIGKKIVLNSRVRSPSNNLNTRRSLTSLEQVKTPGSRLLYSFRDDTTIGNRTNKEDMDYEIMRVHSKSGFELSKIDWSASNNTKKNSVHVSLVYFLL